VAAREQESVEQGDAAFRDLLARVNLAQGRLRFLAQVLQAEFNSVESAISLLESAENKAGDLAESAGRLAADQESLRRSLETEQQALTKGEDTLDLVKKRFNADLKVINDLLDTAADRTATLARRLER
jgi:outer membrane protein TolC